MRHNECNENFESTTAQYDQLDDVSKKARIRGGDEAHLGDNDSKNARVRDLREILGKGRMRD